MKQNKQKILDDIIGVFGSLDNFLDIKIKDWSRETLNISNTRSQLKKKILNNQYTFKNMDLLNIHNYKNKITKGVIIDSKQVLEELKMEYFY